MFEDLDFKKALPLITIVLLILAGCLLGVQAAVSTLDPEAQPEPYRGLLIFLQTTFGAGVFATGLIWLRNIFGFLKAKAQAASKKVAEEYDLNKFYETIAYYVGSIAIVFQIAPTPELRAVGTAIVFFIDMLWSVLTDIFGPFSPKLKLGTVKPSS